MERPHEPFKTLPEQAILPWENRQWESAWTRTAEKIDEHENEPAVSSDHPLNSAHLFNQDPTPENFSYLVDDVRTAVFELLIKRGHISTTEADWDNNARGFRSGPVILREVSLQGLRAEDLTNEERNRRVIELQVEHYIEELYQNGRFENYIMLWVSPYAHDMAQELAEQYGYQTQSKTYMVRSVSVDASGHRVNKQLSMRSSDEQRLVGAMSRLGAELPPDTRATGILMSPLLIEKSQFSGLAEVAKLIDNETEFLGGEADGREYEDLELLSWRREVEAEGMIARYAYRLAEIEKISRTSASERVNEYKKLIKELSTAVAANDPDAAEEAIGSESARLFKSARAAQRQGDLIGAAEQRAAAESSMQDLYMCGSRLTVEASSAASTLRNESILNTCPEFKLGANVTCPECRRTQVITRQNLTKERLYCAYGGCGLARSQTKRPAPVLQLWPSSGHKKSPKPKLRLFG